MAGLGCLSGQPDWTEIALLLRCGLPRLDGLRALRSAIAAAACRWIATSAAGSRGRQALPAAAGLLLNPHAYLDTVVLLGSIGSQQLGEPVGVYCQAIAGSACWFLPAGYGARLLVPLFAWPRAWQVLDAAVALMLWGTPHR